VRLTPPDGASVTDVPTIDMPPAQETPARAAFVMPTVLSRRADFLRAAQGLRHGTPAFLLQARRRAPEEAGSGFRIGFTCSKKVGNSVARNRAKRRLREIARLTLPSEGRDGWDYVLVGRAESTATHPFAQMQADLRRALARLHATGGDP
jgi:ribonuclease P protein component